MYILNYILMASGILFLIAMTLIFFGLFWTPRVKFTENEVHDDYPSPVIRSGRHIIDASDEYDDDADETSNDDLQDDADLDDSIETDLTEESDEPEVSDDDNDSIENDDDTDKNKSKSKTKASRGIDICITIIDTNKKQNITVEDEILIGRSPKCDVVINKPMVSSAHCILIRDGKKLMAEDNHSTNGTMLNGKPLNYVVELKNNDVLTLSDRSIRINFI